VAETAAHLVDQVVPPLPVRQWVLSVPKRPRYFPEREPAAVTAVLHIFLRVVEAHLRHSSPGASARARFGAVRFVHRFGAALNRHLHHHCRILDRYHGVLAPNAPLLLAATASGREADLGGAPPDAKAPTSPAAAATKARLSAHYPWALLIARLFLTLPLVCPPLRRRQAHPCLHH